MLLQNIEILINYSSELFLIGLALFIFISKDRVPGVLIGVFALYSLVIQLAFSGAFGLDFLVAMFVETTSDAEGQFPATGAVLLGIAGGVAKLSLAGGVLSLVRRRVPK